MKKAFTLAEVLITLGIIGVVAAMTMPSLVGKYRQKTVEARLEKFYSAANQAIKLSEVKNGPKEYWDLCQGGGGTMSCEDWYNKYLKDYLKTIKVEHLRLADRNTTLSYFADGSLMILKDGYDIIFYPEAKNFDKNYSVQTDDKGNAVRPDRGVKSFAFAFAPNSTSKNMTYYKGKGIEPYRTLHCTTKTDENGKVVTECNGISHNELLNDSTYGCKNSNYKVYCSALIQENGWKIPEDYPFKF